ncbi:MAG: RNA polymerase sigma factor [Bdellovibrionota bacterium]
MTKIKYSNDNPKNEVLLARYKESDAEAFEEFYRRNSTMLFNYILSKVGNQQYAEEILQDTFLRIHRFVKSFDPSQSAIAWTLQIARNTIIDHFHKNKTLTNPESSEYIAKTNTFNKISAQKSLESFLKQLTPEEYDLIYQRFILEISYEEIAKKYNTRATTIRQRLSRLLRKHRNNILI